MIQIFLDLTGRWASLTAFIEGQQIVVVGGTTTIHQCTTAGTTGAVMPGFNSTPGGTTTDGSVVWTNVAPLSAPAWIVPSTWLNTNTIECIGGGGSGGNGGDGYGGGGGGGGYSKITNLTLTPGSTVSYQIGAGGLSATFSPGGDTWFNGANLGASSVGAKGGGAGLSVIASSFPTPATGGAGGTASGGVGTTKKSGGTGGTVTVSFNYQFSGAGGGGAGGPAGDGGAGGDVSISGTTDDDQYGAGGGGNGGGFAGATAMLTDIACVPGGNNASNFGGGQCPYVVPTDGGGGQGGGRGGAQFGFDGSVGNDLTSSNGSGGGGGGGVAGGGAGGLYGGGGGGGGGLGGGGGGAGAQGVVLLTIGGGGVSLVVQCGSPPLGTVGYPYTYQVPVSGGVPPYTFSVIAGSLPPGLSLNASTGVVSGTPTVAGTGFTYKIQVVDSATTTANTGTCSGTIAPAAAIRIFNCPPVDSATTYGTSPVIPDYVFVDCYTTPFVMDFSYVDNEAYPHFTAFHREKCADDERHLWNALKRAWRAADKLF